MTREEQIYDAAAEYGRKDENAEVVDFVEGAKWADAHPHWISVEEELPPQYGTYLVATEGNVVEISLYDIDGWDNWRGGKVTHWMPLPEPPKKGGEQ